MDPDFEASDDEAATMAAAMGFSAFGSKPPAKKRKFNPVADAFVEGQELAKIDRGGKKGKGSGGNEVALGKTRVFGQGKMVEGNADEIDLGEDDGVEDFGDRGGLLSAGLKNAKLADGNEDEGPQYLDTSLPVPTEHTDDNLGPAYVDTSTAPPIIADSFASAEAAEMQARIDAILNSIGSAPPPTSNDTTETPEDAPSTSTLSPSSTNLPNRPAFSDAGLTRGRSRAGSYAGSVASSRGGSSHGGRGGGSRNERWYEDYYDPSFNYNPWEKIEKAKGLEPRGTWLESPHRIRGP